MEYLEILDWRNYPVVDGFIPRPPNDDKLNIHVLTNFLYTQSLINLIFNINLSLNFNLNEIHINVEHQLYSVRIIAANKKFDK